MIVRNPAVVALIAGYLVSASGALGAVGSTLIGIDNSLKASLDLRKLVPPLIHPKPPVKAKATQ